MALIALDSYVPKVLVGVQAILDEDGSNMVDVYNWVSSLGGVNSATYDPIMWVLSIYTEKNGEPYHFNYNPGYYLVLTPAGELTQITQNTFEMLYQPSA